VEDVAYRVLAAQQSPDHSTIARFRVRHEGFGHLEPMIKATNDELEQIGVSDTPGVAVADSGYWHEEQIDQVVNPGPDPARCWQARHTRRGWDGGRYALMRTVLAGDQGAALYRNARR
jgi:hypothetical protein